MNRSTSTRRTVLNLLTAAALGWMALATSAFAAEKGGERLQSLNRITTYGELGRLKSGDQFAMVCTKCQTVMVHTVTKSKGRDIPTLTSKHLCAGCKSTIESVGHGKAKTDVVKHTCTGCGDNSVFCCATAGSDKATKGMEKH